MKLRAEWAREIREYRDRNGGGAGAARGVRAARQARLQRLLLPPLLLVFVVQTCPVADDTTRESSAKFIRVMSLFDLL